MGTPVSIPTLKTLKTKPSWHNRAGRVDRSACFVLNVRQHWREIPERDWAYRIGLPPSEQWRLNNPRPASDVRGIKGLCDRYAEVTFWARDLWELHKWEPPYPLQGDFRTAKSNALKSGTRAQWVREDAILGNGPINPNRGVGFNQYKMLGLNAMWSTTVRIERVVQHERLRQHFFVCPVCAEKEQKERAGGQRPPGQTKSPGERRSPAIATKLYLPLCTPREWEDARLAQLWLKSHPQIVTHPNRPLPPEVIQVLNRYGELFEPRQLRCRQCLGLRYGELKPSSTSSGGRGSRRAVSHRAHAVRQEPHPPGRPIKTEQSLFLSNLPKLLGQVADTSQQEAAPCRRPAVPSPRPSPTARGGTTIDALSEADQEKLYLLFAQLNRARRVSE